MFKITKEIQIDMGHRVPSHNGHCKNLHGHRYRIVAEVEANTTIKQGSEEGMVADFGIIKQLLMDTIHRGYDHKLVLYAQDPLATAAFLGELRREGIKYVLVPCVPTAEELASWWFDLLSAAMRGIGGGWATLKAVGVWETPTSYAEYRP